MARDSVEIKNLTDFENLIESFSTQQFQTMMSQNCKSQKIKDYQNIAVFGHWLCIILVSHRDMILRIKTHFTTDSGKAMVNALGLSELYGDGLDLNLVIDTLREFNNMVAGQVKESLDTVIGSGTGITLPLITRGFDQHLAMCHVRRTEAVRFFNFWRIDAEKCNIVMSTEIQINDWGILENIKEIQEWTRKKGVIEFL